MIVLVPLTFNDGSAIPRAILDEVFEELFVHFHGSTVRGTVDGTYRMQSGAKRVEKLLEVWVVVDSEDFPLLEALVARFCEKLGQEAMYVERTGAVVKLIAPRPAGERDHD